MASIAVVYYSSTGNAHAVALAVAAGAADAGAEVRVRRVRELAPDEAIAQNPRWVAHRAATVDVPEATLDDLEWADGFAFGTPTRFGVVSAQLKQFLDTTGPLWAKGALADKPFTAFTGSSYAHGGQEATLFSLYTIAYHWGAIVVPPGYTDASVKAAGGNPYGTSYTDPRGAALPEATLTAARFQGARLARFADLLAPARAALRA